MEYSSRQLPFLVRDSFLFYELRVLDIDRWALSNMTDTLTPGYTNQYSAIAGHGVSYTDNYMVSYGNTYIKMDLPTDVSGAYFTNNTYAYLDMKNGSGFTKKFGGENGNDPDYFRVKFYSYLADNLVDSCELYLADFRFEDNAKDYVLDDWLYVDFNNDVELDIKIDSIAIKYESSDMGEFGINTPKYLCMDDFNAISSAEVMPESIVFEEDTFYNGSDAAGGFMVSHMFFPNEYNQNWGSWSDNCYHVFIMSSLTSSAVIDGFIIRDGNANANYNSTLGATQTSYITFDSKTVYQYAGGGIYVADSDVDIDNCIFLENSAKKFGGAGMFFGGHSASASTTASLDNCIVYNNSSDDKGGGFYSWRSLNNNSPVGTCNPVLTNVTICYNSSDNGGGGLFGKNAHWTIKNVLLWGNTKINTNNNNPSSTIKGSDITIVGSVAGNATITSTYCMVQLASTSYNLNNDNVLTSSF